MIFQRLICVSAILALLWGIAGLPLAADAAQTLPPHECAITATSAWTPLCPNLLYSTTTATPDPYAGRSDPGTAIGPIDVWGICRYVDNISASTSVFVPFRSQPEWQAFYKNAPAATVSLVHCSKPQDGLKISASGACSPYAPNPASPFIISEPDYYRCTADGSGGCKMPYAPSWKPQVNFTCTPPVPGAPWQETATATFTGLDSDSGSSWKTPPTMSYTATAATCGSANGSAAASPPASGLCNYGVFSGLSGSGPWTWTCTTGQPPIPVANCSTAAVTNCAAGTETWTVGSATCSGPIAATNNGSSNPVTSTNGNTGTANFTCSSGSYTGPAAGATCAASGTWTAAFAGCNEDPPSPYSGGCVPLDPTGTSCSTPGAYCAGKIIEYYDCGGTEGSGSSGSTVLFYMCHP